MTCRSGFVCGECEYVSQSQMGSAWPIMRIDGKVAATMEEFSRMEQALGPYGGQMTSFEWVFFAEVG